MFIDHVTVEVVAGHGGDGCVSFRREKYVPRGGPNGGDGGRGGDVVVEAAGNVPTLLDLHRRRRYRAGRGEHGRGKSMQGKSGDSVVIHVPPGSVIKDADSGEVLAELLSEGQRFVAASGGKGGLGNERFKSARNQAPRKATPGKPGDSRRLEITLKLIADVGLVGEPNAGKSTLLSVLSAARPKVAPYPFTTKTPVLGIVQSGEYSSFVMVDIPGLIEGAHAGKGMGREFLRHVERCRILLYLIDVSVPDPAASYATLREELLKYDPGLLERPSIVALTKCDLVGENAIPEDALRVHSKVIPISSVTKEGLARLVGELSAVLATSNH
jgi:GTP-binding protein